MSNKVETVLWGSKTIGSKHSKWTFGYRNLPRKWFLSLLWAQKEMLWEFEKDIFQFFVNFWVTKLKVFSRKVGQNVQNYLTHSLVILRFWSYLELKNECSKHLKKVFFSVLQIFDWRTSNRFLLEFKTI